MLYPTAISGEHNIKRSYSSMNALHCLEHLYTVILPSPVVKATHGKI